MEFNQFAQGIALISKHFGKPWPDEAVKAAFDQVKEEPIQSITPAHKRIVLEFSPNPQPPIGKIATIISQEAGKLRQRQADGYETDWNRQNSEKPKFGQANSDHGKKALKLLEAILNGKLDKQKIIEGMEYMDRQHPGMGWREEAAKLASHYRQMEESE